MGQEGPNDTMKEMENISMIIQTVKNRGGGSWSKGTISADSAAIMAWVENQLFYFLSDLWQVAELPLTSSFSFTKGEECH